jgi:hypothetical protein
MVALIPVYEAQAREQGKKGWDMPFPSLQRCWIRRADGSFGQTSARRRDGRWRVAGKYDVKEGWVDVWVGRAISWHAGRTVYENDRRISMAAGTKSKSSRAKQAAA